MGDSSRLRVDPPAIRLTTNALVRNIYHRLNRLFPVVLPMVGGLVGGAIRKAYRWAKARPWLRRWLLHPSIARFKADLACRLMVRDEGYEKWLAARVAERSTRFPCPEHPGLISFLTTVWNTPAKFLAPMAESVLDQSPHRSFEWVLLDNGSTAPDTLRELARIARDSRVRCLRVETNLGIVGGMRYCLERATGRYVVPVDSDDLLARDTVATLARHLSAAGWPALAYSDEDHLIGRRRVLPYFKPEWDPVLFANSAFIAHLGVIDRVRALELGVYSDDSAKGCHDWDTFVRFLAAGETPLHIPEMLYSWRMHAQSTAANVASKDYIHASHRATLGRLQSGFPHPERFELVPSPLFDGTPDWWFRRLPIAPPAVSMVVAGGDADGCALPVPFETDYPRLRLRTTDAPTGTDLLDAALSCGPEGFVAIRDAAAEPERPEWIWEAIGLCERFPDTACVAGPVLDDAGVVLEAGAFAGADGRWISPDAGQPVTDSGYFGQMWKQRSVTGAPGRLCVLRGDFARQLARTLPSGTPVDWRALSIRIAAEALRSDRRVVLSPFLRSRIPGETAANGSKSAACASARPVPLETEAADLALLVDDRRYYPAELGGESPYRPTVRKPTLVRRAA